MTQTLPTSVTLLMAEGDGIGPEICGATERVLVAVGEAVGIDFDFSRTLIGFDALHAHGTTFPAAALEAAKAVDGVILGPVSHNEYPPVAEGGLNPSGQLRKQLDLYANIRPAKSLAGLPPPCGKPIDLVIVRENTEGFYADRAMFMGPGEFMPTPDVALAVRKITRENCMRIARSAFELAMTRRKQVTAVHKANVLRLSDGLFLECTRKVAKNFPEVRYDEKLIDAMTALLIRDPGRFDVICTTNMYGDILSDEASELSGSLGLAASLNAGTDYAVAQAQHGSAPDIAGKDMANPASLIGSAAMLLAWLAARRDCERLAAGARMIDAAIAAAAASPETRTADLGGGKLGTAAFTDHLVSHIATMA